LPLGALTVALGCGAERNGLRQVSSDAHPVADSGRARACVEFQAEARFRNNGYDHIVHLRSRCDKHTYCSVATDVNPTPVNVEVPPRQQLSVLTFRGSPAREFTPKLTCRF
jgi:hypothetical protein